MAAKEKLFALSRNVEEFRRLSGQVNIFWKDLDGCFLGANDNTVEMVGYRSEQEMIGMTDYDGLFLSEFAHIYIEEDIIVMRCGCPKQFYCCGIQHDGVLIRFLSIKAPLYDEKHNIVGVFGMSPYLEQEQLTPSEVVTKFEKCKSESAVELGTFLSNPFASRPTEKKIVSGVELTIRQTETLFYLTRGMSSKEIAQVLNISYRTVDVFIQQLKDKLKCHKRSTLIAKALGDSAEEV